MVQNIVQYGNGHDGATSRALIDLGDAAGDVRLYETREERRWQLSGCVRDERTTNDDEDEDGSKRTKRARCRGGGGGVGDGDEDAIGGWSVLRSLAHSGVFLPSASPAPGRDRRTGANDRVAGRRGEAVERMRWNNCGRTTRSRRGKGRDRDATCATG